MGCGDRSCQPEMSTGFGTSDTLNYFNYYEIKSSGGGGVTSVHGNKKKKVSCTGEYSCFL